MEGQQPYLRQNVLMASLLTGTGKCHPAKAFAHYRASVLMNV
jgi:hypothetical protein